MNIRLIVPLVLLQCVASLQAWGLPATNTGFLAAVDAEFGVLKLDPATGVSTGTLFASTGLNDIELGPDGLLYLCNFQQQLVQAIDPFAGSLVHSIAFPERPTDIAFGPDGRLYVCMREFPFFGGVFSVDLNNSYAIEKFNQTDFGGDTIALQFGPDGDLYVSVANATGDYQHRVDRLNGITGALEYTVASQETSIAHPVSVAFASDGTLYVGNQGFGGGGWISRYTTDGDYLETLQVSASNFTGLNFLPDGDLVWGTSDSYFMRYDFELGSAAPFGSGLRMSAKMIIIPEPTAAVLVLLAAVGFVQRSRSRL